MPLPVYEGGGPGGALSDIAGAVGFSQPDCLVTVLTSSQLENWQYYQKR